MPQVPEYSSGTNPRPMKKKLRASGAFCGALAAVAVTAFGALPPKESQEFDGKQAVDFSLKGAKDGSDIALKNYAGKAVVIEFFASWCPPCRTQLTELSKLHAKYAGKGLAVIAIAVDPIETPDTVEEVAPLADQLKLPYPVALGTEQVTQAYHYKGFPATVIVGPDGKIARIFFGLHNADKLDAVIKGAVEAQKPQ